MFRSLRTILLHRRPTIARLSLINLRAGLEKELGLDRREASFIAEHEIKAE